MSKIDWEKDRRNRRPKDDGSHKDFLEFRADRYLEAVDKARDDRRKQKGVRRGQDR